MKVVCKDNKDCKLRMTIGKSYNVIKDTGRGYLIINDFGVEDWEFKKYFKTLSEIRNEKIDKLLK